MDLITTAVVAKVLDRWSGMTDRRRMTIDRNYQKLNDTIKKFERNEILSPLLEAPEEDKNFAGWVRDLQHQVKVSGLSQKLEVCDAASNLLRAIIEQDRLSKTQPVFEKANKYFPFIFFVGFLLIYMFALAIYIFALQENSIRKLFLGGREGNELACDIFIPGSEFALIFLFGLGLSWAMWIYWRNRDLM